MKTKYKLYVHTPGLRCDGFYSFDKLAEVRRFIERNERAYENDVYVLYRQLVERDCDLCTNDETTELLIVCIDGYAVSFEEEGKK